MSQRKPKKKDVETAQKRLVEALAMIAPYINSHDIEVPPTNHKWENAKDVLARRAFSVSK